MNKQKAGRNKTIDFGMDEAQKYLERCIGCEELADLSCFNDLTILADTFEALKMLPEKSADLIIVDPPYNLRKSFHGNVFNKKNQDEYREYTAHWISSLKNILKDNGSIYVCCDWQSSIVIAPVLQESFTIRSRITWQRDKGRGAKRNWKNQMEDIWYCTLSDSYTFNLSAVKQRRRVLAPYKEKGSPKDWESTPDGKLRDTHPSNFWDDISIPFWSMPENTAHPTQKPEKLVAKLILASSNEGDLVLDPFLGSGTTSVVAKKLGRHYIGIEQNPIYCAWACKRLEDAEDNRKIQGYDDGVFWERNTQH